MKAIDSIDREHRGLYKGSDKEKESRDELLTTDM